MGTINSASKDMKNKINVSQDESSDFEFKALKTIKDMNNQYLSQGQSETAENTKNEINEQKILYTFEWKEGGNDVKIAGSFLDNWKKKEEMKKNLETGIFEIKINIPRGIHQFKFIVYEKWRCSPNYDIIHESNNNDNNIINLTNYIPTNANEINNNTQNKKKKKKTGKVNIDYGCKYPNLNEVNSEAPNIPMHYIPRFNLNNQTKQKLVENKYNIPLTLNKKRNILENNSFKTIITITHEKLSHLCFNNEEDNSNETYIRTAVTQRNKHKFITLVYFSPNK
jgi:5'-AMP-activated protein kinase regulatory beta subunit